MICLIIEIKQLRRTVCDHVLNETRKFPFHWAYDDINPRLVGNATFLRTVRQWHHRFTFLTDSRQELPRGNDGTLPLEFAQDSPKVRSGRGSS
jgi:hypothetical protein